jgi:hypothetical protein
VLHTGAFTSVIVGTQSDLMYSIRRKTLGDQSLLKSRRRRENANVFALAYEL